MKLLNKIKEKFNSLNKSIFLYMLVGGVIGAVIGYGLVKFVLAFI